MKRKIIVACGGAVATSTMAAEEIKELCQSHNIPVELIQCRVNEIETYMDGVHLICTTAKVERSFGDIPLVHGMPFVSGVGIEALQINSDYLTGVTYVFRSHALYSRPRPYGDAADCHHYFF